LGRRKGSNGPNRPFKDQLKDLSLVHPQTNPFEVPFASSDHSAHTDESTLNVAQRPTTHSRNDHRRRIVLTSERMNDEYLALDDMAALESRHQRLFKATKTGWTRVTEIDADSPIGGELPAAFGCSAN